jgi:hypothetical protein
MCGNASSYCGFGHGNHQYTVLPKCPGFPDSEKLCVFASLREKNLKPGSCQKYRGVKSDSREGAKAQRKMEGVKRSWFDG